MPSQKLKIIVGGSTAFAAAFFMGFDGEREAYATYQSGWTVTSSVSPAAEDVQWTNVSSRSVTVSETSVYWTSSDDDDGDGDGDGSSSGDGSSDGSSDGDGDDDCDGDY